MPQIKRTLLVNDSNGQANTLRLNLTTVVNRADMSRETVNGVEHIRITSYTLPENIVMNGILYPTEERDKSFMTLDRTPAPVEHPVNEHGQYISAVDPIAINNFYAGAYNENPRIDGNRIAVDKVINVQEAMKSDRGKRMLDRIEQVMKGNNSEPVHTSVGVFVDLQHLDASETNDAGQEYTAIATNMFFDHDAILLDNVGAAQPSQGVGLGVNKKGDQVDLQVFHLEPESTDEGDKEAEDKRLVNNDLSFWEITSEISKQLRGDQVEAYVCEVYDDYFIYEEYESGNLYRRDYTVDNDQVQIGRESINVERVVTYKPVGGNPVTTTTDEGEAMKEKMLAFFKANNIEVPEGISDDEMLDLYANSKASLQANQSDDTGDKPSDIEKAVAAALEPVVNKIAAVESKLTANAEAELTGLRDLVNNSAKAKELGLTEEDVKALPEASLRKIAASCKQAHGVPFGQPAVNSGLDNTVTNVADLPE